MSRLLILKLLGICLLVSELIFICLVIQGQDTSTNAVDTTTPDRPIYVMALGDISCGSATQPTATECQGGRVAEAVKRRRPDALLLLGDLQYDRGELTEFQLNFDRDWGTLRDISHAVPGNHEYATPKAEGYFTYWSGDKASSNQAGERGKGYYSFDIGSWHFIALNSNCEHIGGCGEDLDQSKWLKNDITVASNKCTIAFWHHPVFTVGRYSENRQQTIKGETFWRLLDGNAAIILNGHDHNYQRFEPQNLQGLPSPQSPRQFVV